MKEIMNPYLKNLNRIEFVITRACTGKCIHCQQGDHESSGKYIDAETAAEAVCKICQYYPIRTLMTFGGEPLLFPDTVCRIQKTAGSLGISRRQIITSGYFSAVQSTIEKTVRELADSGVNDLLLSVDAFHQAAIPLEPVIYFAECAGKFGIPVTLNPAWLIGPEDRNKYNLRTREIINEFASLKIRTGSGNVVFPSGNALIYLKDYFDENTAVSSPYDEDPEDIRSLSFDADGTVLNGNIYETDILDIIRTYRP